MPSRKTKGAACDHAAPLFMRKARSRRLSRSEVITVRSRPCTADMAVRVVMSGYAPLIAVEGG
jgi:hypothetical protein